MQDQKLKTAPVAAGVIPFDANVEMELRDKDGNIKPMFQENWLARKMLNSGILSPLWLNWKLAFALEPLFGYWTTSKVFKNGITDAGRAAMASRCNGSGGAAAFTSIGQGTDTTAFSVSQTALGAGVTSAGSADSGVHVLPAASVTVSRVTTTVTNDTAQLTGTVTMSGSAALTESGVFNADTNGTMLARQTFSVVNVVSGDQITYTWKIKAA